jgi:hypothetical protein
MYTVCGDPDYCVLLWQHDILRLLARIDLGITEPGPGNFQISAFNVSTAVVLAITGPQCYRFFKVNETNNGFTVLQSQMKVKDPQPPR